MHKDKQGLYQTDSWNFQITENITKPIWLRPSYHDRSDISSLNCAVLIL